MPWSGIKLKIWWNSEGTDELLISGLLVGWELQSHSHMFVKLGLIQQTQSKGWVKVEISSNSSFQAEHSPKPAFPRDWHVRFSYDIMSLSMDKAWEGDVLDMGSSHEYCPATLAFASQLSFPVQGPSKLAWMSKSPILLAKHKLYQRTYICGHLCMKWVIKIQWSQELSIKSWLFSQQIFLHPKFQIDC